MMNKFQFKLHRKIFGDKTIDRGILEYLYNNYSEYCSRLNMEPALSEIDYKSIVSTIYSVLSLRVKDSDFLFIINGFSLYMVKDQCEGLTVDPKWAIDNVRYLSLSRKNINLSDTNYRQSLGIVKECLIEKYDLKEEYKTKKKTR